MEEPKRYTIKVFSNYSKSHESLFCNEFDKFSDHVEVLNFSEIVNQTLLTIFIIMRVSIFFFLLSFCSLQKRISCLKTLPQQLQSIGALITRSKSKPESVATKTKLSTNDDADLEEITIQPILLVDSMNSVDQVTFTQINGNKDSCLCIRSYI